MLSWALHLVGGCGEVCFPFVKGFQKWILEIAISYRCHDANKNAKVEKLFVFFITKLGLLHYAVVGVDEVIKGFEELKLERPAGEDGEVV